MAKITLTCPRDGLIVSEVGIWAKEKHEYLRRYIEISSKARVKYILDANNPEKYTAGATYIDLFCGSGRSRVKGSNEWIDGSPIAAWKASLQSGAPFTQIYIADSDEQNLLACKKRLEALGANVVARQGAAIDVLREYCEALSPYGLHFTFIDPFNLKSLDFTILESLSALKRIDMLIHLSKMDLQRNLVKNLRHYESDFDAFVPGWRDKFDINQGMKNIRQQVIDFWIVKVKALGVSASKDTDWKLITGKRKQPLYWLMLIAKHELAHKFWNAASAAKQDNLF